MNLNFKMAHDITSLKVCSYMFESIILVVNDVILLIITKLKTLRQLTALTSQTQLLLQGLLCFASNINTSY